MSEEQLIRTSLGVEGWACSRVLTESDLAGSCRGDSPCCAFGGRRECGDDPGSDPLGCSSDLDESHNSQVMRLITVLGNNGAGRRAILQAVAKQQGITGEDDLEELYSGKSSVKLKAPRYIRQAMIDVGLESVLAPVHVLTFAEPENILLSDENWKDIEFEVALDSGSVVHVCSMDDVPGYQLGESPGSRRGQEFLMGDGGLIPNLGQSQLNLSDTAVGRNIESVFQIAAVTRPLMSVGRICDEGHSITFDAIMAVVHAKDGSEVCRFQRNGSGLYVAKLKLRSPAGFGGQE